MKSEEEIINHLNNTLKFFESVQVLANSHVASFFSENLWKNVPDLIQEEMNNFTAVNDFIKMHPKMIKMSDYPNGFHEKYPNLTKFLYNACNNFISNENTYTTTLINLKNLFLIKNCFTNCDFQEEKFMSSKKVHEVKITSEVTAAIASLTKSSHIVDLGSGKGYLSSALVLNYSSKVLGLDASQLRTCGAIKRAKKVAKQWKGKVFDNEEFSHLNSKKKENFIEKNYIQIIHHVTFQTDVKKIIKDNFEEDIKGITLTGLHTCGNLASTALQMFIANNDIKALLNIGCCYHYITEKFSNDKSCDLKEDELAFPMSLYLKEKKFTLGRNAKILAQHSLEKMYSNSELDELGQTSLFYRAVLETVLKSNGNFSQSSQAQVGKLAKKCKTLHEYINKAFKKLKINYQISENDSIELYKAFIDRKPLLTAFYLLKVSLAQVIESIILLDRLLYLRENGITHSYLVKLFDLQVSPRGFGIIAWKNEDTVDNIEISKKTN